MSVGTLLDKYKVGVRRCEDGSINIIVSDNNTGCRAVFQRIQTGVCLLNSTFADDVYREVYKALELNLTYIDRRCIELTEAEMRIPYVMVCKEDGNIVSVGQSNSLAIYIVVENSECRAIFQYSTDNIKFIRSTYTAEQGEHIRNIVKHNLKAIMQVMEERNMVENKSKRQGEGLYTDGFVSKMTELGKRERERVDTTIETIFRELDKKGYSNLEVQSMLLEAVFEVSLNQRIKNQNQNGYSY